MFLLWKISRNVTNLCTWRCLSAAWEKLRTNYLKWWAMTVIFHGMNEVQHHLKQNKETWEVPWRIFWEDDNPWQIHRNGIFSYMDSWFRWFLNLNVSGILGDSLTKTHKHFRWPTGGLFGRYNVPRFFVIHVGAQVSHQEIWKLRHFLRHIATIEGTLPPSHRISPLEKCAGHSHQLLPVVASPGKKQRHNDMHQTWSLFFLNKLQGSLRGGVQGEGVTGEP